MKILSTSQHLEVLKISLFKNKQKINKRDENNIFTI
jgi:hypothetical protein